MPIKTLTVGPGLLTIGSDTELTVFSEQVRACKIVPNVTKGDPVPVLSGGELPGDRTETFTLDATFLQDFGTENSTTEWLYEHRGEVHDFVYVPNTATGRRITGQLEVEAIEIGGEVKSKPTSDVSFPLVGEPVFDDAP